MAKDKGYTPGLGIEYEIYTPVYFALRLLTNPTIEDFLLESNVEGFLPFDDLLVSTTSKDGERNRYAFQLKHTDSSSRKVALASFSAKDGIFNLHKYYEGYKKITNKENYQYILFTNRGFMEYKTSTSNETFKMYSRVSDDNLRIFDTSNQDGNIFKFENEDKEMKIFFENFSLFISQQNQEDLQNNVIEFFKTNFNTSNDQPAVNFINFFRRWHKGEFTNKKLDKQAVRLHVVDSLLEQAIIRPQNLNQNNEKFNLLQEAIRKFDMTVLEDDNVSFFQENWNMDLTVENDDLLMTGQQLKFISKKTSAVKDDIRDKLLWYNFQEPVLVRIDKFNEDMIEKTLGFCNNLKLICFMGVGATPKKLLRHNPQSFETLSDLMEVSDENLYQLMVKKFFVSLQGRKPVPLKSLTEHNPNLNTVITVEDLVLMVKEKVVIGESSEKLDVSCYVPRRVSAPISLNAESLLEIYENSVVVICCPNKIEEARNYLMKTCRFTHIVTFDQYKESDVKAKTNVIILSNEELSEKDFARTTRLNINYFRLREGLIIYVATFKGSRRMIRRVTRSCVVTKESKIFKYFQNNINLICAAPGMGKSIMVQYLSRICPKDYWCVRIDLKSCVSKKNQRVLENVLKEIEAQSLSKRLEKEILESLINERKVCFLLDGFDELSRDYIETTLQSIRNLNTKGYKLILTIRNNYRDFLEENLDTIVIDIESFNENDQKYFIQQRLQDTQVCNNSEIDNIFKKISSSIKRADQANILGVPLQLFMITEIIINDMKVFETIDDNCVLTKIYDLFFTGKLIHYLKKIVRKGHEVNLVSRLGQEIKFYQACALKTCLEKSLFERLVKKFKLEYLNFMERIKKHGDDLGIITSITHNMPLFEHFTYAEYLTASFLAENYRKIENITEVITHQKYENIKLMFDMILAEKSRAHLAVLYRDLDELKKCPQTEILSTDEAGRSTLQIACAHEFPNFELEEIRKNYVFKDHTELTQNSKEIINYLLNQGLDLQVENLANLPNRDRLFEIIYYVYCCVKFSLHSNLDIMLRELEETHNTKVLLKIRINGSQTLLHFAVMNNDPKTVNMLLKHNFKSIINSTSEVEDGEGLLHLAIMYDSDTEIIQDLLHFGAKIDLLNESEETPLYNAIYRNNLELVQLLLSRGAMIHVTNDEGDTPLHYAVRKSNYRIISLLLSQGASIKARNSYGDTALHLACFHRGVPEIVELLLRSGADVNAANKLKETPLYSAVEQNYVDTVKLLISSGANVNVQNFNKYSLVHLCVFASAEEMLNLLLSNGANVNLKDEFKSTPLFYAVKKNDVEIVKLLVEHGANVGVKNLFDVSPIDLARESKIDEIVKLFEGNGKKVRKKRQNDQ